MTFASNVPALQFTPTGIVLPTESAVLTGVQADQNLAFGGGLNLGLSTPQGQLATSLTAIIGDKNAQIALLRNQMDPDVNSGVWQDAIARIYFLSRNPAVPTSVLCNCMGAVGTVIPQGSQAQDGSGNRYMASADGVIGVSGTVSIPFVCTVSGPTSCPPASITQIYKSIPGWDTVTNPGAGVPGSLVESRGDFAYRREQSVALNGNGSLPSIKANVLAVDDVLDVYAAENTTSATITLGATNVSLVPHSIYVAVTGGLAADVASAIWLKKSCGADYNGNTSVTVRDTVGYDAPYPSYVIKYQVPAPVAIQFAVVISADPALPSNITALIQAAIVNAFSGADGGVRARIGSRIFASRFYAAITLTSPAVEILSVLIGTSAPTLNSLTVGIDQAPTVTAANITVTLV